MGDAEEAGRTTHGRSTGRLYRHLGYAVGVSLLVVGLLFVASGGSTAMQEGSAAEDFVVDLESDGTAVVSLEVNFDLTDPDQRRAFEQLRANETKQQELLDRYETRMENVGARTDAETDRDMSVSDPEIETGTDSDAGVGTVRTSVSWSGFAATDGKQLELGAPLDSGFSSDTSVVVMPPEGYAVTSATPEPATTQVRAVWNADQELTGFTATVQPTETGEAGTTEDSVGDTEADGESDGSADADETGPGFGAAVVTLATVVFAVVARRRSQ